MAPLEYHFMAGKAQEVQVGDINIRKGWETLMANCSRAMVTEVEGSTIQAHVAKLLQASGKSTLIMRQGTYIVVSCLVWVLMVCI